MLYIVWEFQVSPANRDAFERLYGPRGAWADLFRTDPAYLGTDLYRSTERPGWYLTLDRWRTRGAYEAFHREHAEEYKALDSQGELLTEREVALGTFEGEPTT